MDDAATRRRFPRRIAVLVGFGALAPVLAIAWLGDSALSALGEALLSERRSLAAAVAARMDEALDARLMALGSLGPVVGADAPLDGPVRAAVHEAWRRSRPLQSVALFAPDGRELLREPADSPPVPFHASERPAVVGPVPSEVGPRALLVYPLRDYRGQTSAVAVGSLDPADAHWLSLLELRPPRGDVALWLEGSDGRPLTLDGVRPPAVVSAALTSAPWRVALGARLADPARTARRYLLWLVPALVALALMFGWGAARSVTDPVATLTEAADHIASGDLDRPVPDVGVDEVGRLGAALEAMRAALRRDRSRGRLLERVIAAQEDERRRIARELHDETCQTLAALSLAVRGGREGEATALADRALDGIRALIYDLRPGVLDDLGLAAAIRWLADRHLAARGISVRCEIEELPARLRPEVETALFRAVQEALVNVARHAEAEAVLIQAGPAEGRLRIEVEDDGAGFDPQLVATPSPDGRGLGLLGMRERLALVGGRAEVDSAPGHGTRVVLEAPLGAAA